MDFKCRVVLVTILASGLAFAGCSGGSSSTPVAGNTCGMNSDCAQGLTCSFGHCQSACKEARDCPNNEQCVKDASGINTCLLPAVETCNYSSQCPLPLVCATDLKCRNQCLADRDCATATQKCVLPDGVCAEPSAISTNGGLQNAVVGMDAGVPAAGGTGGGMSTGGSGGGTGSSGPALDASAYGTMDAHVPGVGGVMSAGGSGGSAGSSGSTLDPTAFGQKYKFSNNELPGWTQPTAAQDPTAFVVYTGGDELVSRIDGAADIYNSRGCRMSMFQDLVGPYPEISTVVAMDFGTTVNANSMFTYQKSNSFPISIPGYDPSVAIGSSTLEGVIAYAHFSASYFEVQLSGFADTTSASAVAAQFLNVLVAKTGGVSPDAGTAPDRVDSGGGTSPGTPGVVTFSSGQAQGAMTGYGWLALGASSVITDPTCSGAPITNAAPCMTVTNWDSPTALCMTGTVPAAIAGDYSTNWGAEIGVNANESSGPIGTAYSTIALSVSGYPLTGLRISIHRYGDVASTNYCVPYTASPVRLIDFNTACWDGSGVQFTAADAAKIDQVILDVPSTQQTITVSNLCLNSITFGGGTTPVSPVDAGGAAIVTVSPTILNFGSVDVGQTSSPMAVLVTNLGPATSLSPMVDGSEFSLVATTCSTLPAGGSCTISVAFTPMVTGPAAGTLVVAGTVMVSLTGIGTVPVAFTQTDHIDLGTVLVGASVHGKVTVTATTPLPDLICSASGADVMQDLSTTTCPTAAAGALAKGATCFLGFTFSSATAGAKTDSVVCNAVNQTRVTVITATVTPI